MRIRKQTVNSHGLSPFELEVINEMTGSGHTI